jgi:hypothetical protein
MAADVMMSTRLAPLLHPLTERLLITLRDQGIKTLLVAKGQEGGRLEVDGIQVVEMMCVLHAFIVAKSLVFWASRKEEQAAAEEAASMWIEDGVEEDDTVPQNDDTLGCEEEKQ